jgi:DNA-binding NarL/FixJ family response regulator
LEQTRILLLGVTTMLGELVRGIVAADQRLRVVGVLDDPAKLIDISRRRRADVVVVPIEGEELPAACRELLQARPRTRIVGLVEHGRVGVLWEMCPSRTAIGELSPASLRAALLGDGAA